jgi:hypothetical protein
MSELLENVNNRAGEYKGKRLGKLLIVIFAAFLLIGVGSGFLIDRLIDRDIPLDTTENSSADEQDFYEGTVTYIEPLLYAADDISYILVDKQGDDLILLKSKDQKLEVSEGHWVTVYGKVRKTVAQEDFLLVEKVVIRNVPN